MCIDMYLVKKKKNISLTLAKLEIIVLPLTHPDIKFSFLNSAFGRQWPSVSDYNRVVYVRSIITSTTNKKAG